MSGIEIFLIALCIAVSIVTIVLIHYLFKLVFNVKSNKVKEKITVDIFKFGMWLTVVGGTIIFLAVLVNYAPA